MTENQPFCISKWAVLRAWHKVRANRGAAGVDDVSISQFEQKLKNNLYKIWNRMSSGTYFSPPVKRVMNPKLQGWINYYGRYYRSALHRTFGGINSRLVRWARRTYKRLRTHGRQARLWLRRLSREQPRLFAHLQLGVAPQGHGMTGAG